MPNYIDADKALKFIKETNANYHWLLSQYSASWIYDFIESQPTADVVPRADYENLKIELAAMRGAATSYKMHYEGLAREIFEDIQSCIVHRNWDEWRENILSFVVDAEKYAELWERYMKGDEGK